MSNELQTLINDLYKMGATSREIQKLLEKAGLN